DAGERFEIGLARRVEIDEGGGLGRRLGVGGGLGRGRLVGGFLGVAEAGSEQQRRGEGESADEARNGVAETVGGGHVVTTIAGGANFNGRGDRNEIFMRRGQ